MYYIYKITNLINNKLYVGSTNSVFNRWRQHLAGSKYETMPTYNYPLQKAIRKYGKENFLIETIYESSDALDISNKEREFIISNNSLTNSGWGYNQTLYTDCALRDPEVIRRNIENTARKCCLLSETGIVLKLYESLNEAGRDLNLEPTLIKKSCDGIVKSASGNVVRYYVNEEIIHIPFSNQSHLKVCGISIYDMDDIIIFNNISEASRKTGIPRTSISKCVNGSSRYSRVNKRIWRKIDLFGNVIDNEIKIETLLKYER